MIDIALKQGDCLELMKDIPDGSIDMILCDLPYGNIKGLMLDGWNNADTSWDERLDMCKLFTEYERVLRRGGTVILFSQEPYTSELRTYKASNIIFAYPLIWKKDHFASPLSVKKAPVSYFEDLTVFYKLHDSQLLHPLREYSKNLLRYIGKNKKEVISDIGQRVDHFLRHSSSQFTLCTESTYNELIYIYKIDQVEGFKSFGELENIERKFKRKFKRNRTFG